MMPTLNERQSALNDAWPHATTPYLHALAHQEARAITVERDALARSCQRMVCFVANRFQRNRRWLDVNDLIGSGNVGLVKAAGQWRPGGVKFGTYAMIAIRRHVFDNARFQEQLVKGASHVRQLPYDLSSFTPQRLDDGWVERTLKHLDERERHVVKRITIDGCILRVVADEMQLSRERVRQLHQRALRRLRKKLKTMAA